MTTWKRLAVLLLFAAAFVPAQGRDFGRLYSSDELQRANGVYSPNVRGMVFEDVARYLHGNEISSLRRVTLLQPWNRTVDPFEFSANPATGAVLVPTLSVKFFDDVSIATAWFERHGCNKESVFDYVAAMDFSDLDLPPPLTALAVPPKAYELDDYVDDVSQKTLKSALVFLLLHELGHVHHRHRPYDQISAADAQKQEAEADLFAMQVLRRMRLPPLGMTVWFMAASMRDPLIEGSPSQTHPLTSSRLRAIAAELRRRPGDFIEPANRGRITPEQILAVAGDIDGIGRLLDDPDLRSFLRERGRRATPALLSSACQAQQHSDDWMRRFQDLLR